MNSRAVVKKISLLIAIISCLVFSAYSQSDSGSAAIEGTVKDQNGAVVQGATIVIKNKDICKRLTIRSSPYGRNAG